MVCSWHHVPSYLRTAHSMSQVKASTTSRTCCACTSYAYNHMLYALYRNKNNHVLNSTSNDKTLSRERRLPPCLRERYAGLLFSSYGCFPRALLIVHLHDECMDPTSSTIFQGSRRTSTGMRHRSLCSPRRSSAGSPAHRHWLRLASAADDLEGRGAQHISLPRSAQRHRRRRSAAVHSPQMPCHVSQSCSRAH